MKNPCIITILLLAYSIKAGAVKWMQFQRTTSFDGAVCEDTDIAFSKEYLKEKLMCLIECTTSASCKSIFYVQHTRSCTGCTVIYDSTSNPTGEADGSAYYLKAKCSEGWFNIQKSCYFITGNMYFEEGVKECQSLKAHPVIIETEEENNSLKSKLRLNSSEDSPRAYFTEYTDAAIEGTWTAVNTTKPLVIDDWASGEPDQGTTENCLALYRSLDFKWVDISCQAYIKTICEKETLY